MLSNICLIPTKEAVLRFLRLLYDAVMKKISVARQIGGFMKSRLGTRPLRVSTLLDREQDAPDSHKELWDEKLPEESEAADNFAQSLAAEEGVEFGGEPPRTIDPILSRIAKESASKPRHVLITGVPGVGKTTEGRKLSKETGMPLISLDGLTDEYRGPGRWVRTDGARRLISELDEPHIIEGAQLLGLKEHERKGHDFRLLREPRKVVVDRLIRRGWEDDKGRFRQGPNERAAAGRLYDSMSKLSAENRLRMALRRMRRERENEARAKQGYTDEWLLAPA